MKNFYELIMQSNKANPLGQSKASLRFVLPAGDLRRWIVRGISV